MLGIKKYQIFLFLNDGKYQRQINFGRWVLFSSLFLFFMSFVVSYKYFSTRDIFSKEINVYSDSQRDFNMAFLQLSKYLFEKSNQLKEEKVLYDMFGYNSHFEEREKQPYKMTSPMGVDSRQSLSESALSSLATISVKSGLFLRNLDNTISVDKVKENFSSVVPYGWPLKDHVGVITSPFGARFSPFERIVKYHTGVDLGAIGGTYIIASGDGVVEFANYRGDLGFAVIIRHDNNYSTRYGHMQQILVREGQSVKKGDTIGRVGLSGRTTGYHLHFEVRYKNEPVNPMPYIRDSQ